MDDNEVFTRLLFSHKHLWVRYQAMKHLREFPNDDPELAQERFCEAADEVYQPLIDALREGQPIQDALQTVLSVADIALAEGRHL